MEVFSHWLSIPVSRRSVDQCTTYHTFTLDLFPHLLISFQRILHYLSLILQSFIFIILCIIITIVAVRGFNYPSLRFERGSRGRLECASSSFFRGTLFRGGRERVCTLPFGP